MAAKKRNARPGSRRSSVGPTQRASLQKSESLAQAARQAWQHHQYERTISLYEDALRRDPTNYTLLVDLARAYGLRYRFREAEEKIANLLRLNPRSVKIRLLVARTYAMIGRPAKAIEHFEQALEWKPEHPDVAEVLVELAALYEQCRRPADARRAINHASKLAPDRTEVLYRQALHLADDGQPQEALAQLIELVERRDVSSQTQSDAWYEIGKLYDRQGDFDAAMSVFQRAKKLLQPQAERFQKEAAFLRERHQVMLDQLTAEHFRSWKEAGAASQPRRLALLPDIRASGTTLLEQVLDGHTDLISADEYLTFGEFIFRPIASQQPRHIPTPDGLDHLSTESLAHFRDHYWQTTEALLDQPIGSRLLLDKNPSLSYLLPVICRVFPEIKVLFALRDPRDVVISCFMQRLPLNAIAMNYLSLEATAEKYADAMRYWLRIRPMLSCDWREVRYEDTVADLPKQADHALQFLDLPWQAQVLDFHTHAQAKQVRSPTFQEVTQPIYSHAIGRWRNYAKHLEPVLAKLEPLIAAFQYD